MSNNQWLRELSLNDTVGHIYKKCESLYSVKSEFQEIEVVQTEALGKVLLLDGVAMISDKDEFIYHEVMTHLPLLVQNKTKRVLVVGAGDGGVVRELCRYSSIEKIQLVEIDPLVISTSKEFFPQVSCSLNDPRVEIIHADGNKFIDECYERGDSFDLIISDSTDPEGIAEGLYQEKFFNKVNELLSEEGIFMCQTETPLYDEFGINLIYQKLRSAFNIVQTACAPILIYPGVYWTFGFCSKKWKGDEFKEHKMNEYQSFGNDLKWHNPKWQEASFVLSNFYQQAIQ